MVMMYDFDTEYGELGFMPDGEKREFVSSEEYREAYEDQVEAMQSR